jgi:hypothetical protein
MKERKLDNFMVMGCPWYYGGEDIIPRRFSLGLSGVGRLRFSFRFSLY